MRKIIHVDMDAFYASVEQRDQPQLRGKPVIVAWTGPRSVVCAASYEARKFGVRSAMPAVRAERLCPQGIFVPPDFIRYRAVSHRIREIFHQHSDLVEPLSLDEAYLDVTENKRSLPTATKVAQAIRAEINRETELTASAGVAPNKFLAKIASDWRKPDGLFVIQPHEVLDFLAPLTVARLPGVGAATDHQLRLLGISTIRELRALDESELTKRFGRLGRRLFHLARGDDDHPVVSDRPLQQVSVEQTLERDQPLYELTSLVRDMALRAWQAIQKSKHQGRTVVLKLKTSDFRLLTRSSTPPNPIESEEMFCVLACSLLQRIDLPESTLYRLVGVGITNFITAAKESSQPTLF